MGSARISSPGFVAFAVTGVVSGAKIRKRRHADVLASAQSSANAASERYPLEPQRQPLNPSITRSLHERKHSFSSKICLLSVVLAQYASAACKLRVIFLRLVYGEEVVKGGRSSRCCLCSRSFPTGCASAPQRCPPSGLRWRATTRRSSSTSFFSPTSSPASSIRTSPPVSASVSGGVLMTGGWVGGWGVVG